MKLLRSAAGVVLLMCITLVIPSFSTLAIAQSPTGIPISAYMTIEEWAEVNHPTEDCPLPCFYGVIPGETSVYDLPDLISAHFEGSYVQEDMIDDDTSGVSIYNNLPLISDDNQFYSSVAWTSFRVEDRIVQSISLGPPTSRHLLIATAPAWQYFDIGNMLAVTAYPILSKHKCIIGNLEHLANSISKVWH